MNSTLIIKVAAVLWVIWGLVHAAAGTIVLSSTTEAGFAAIADAVAPQDVAHDYHGAVGAILGQHAWNLLWFGIVTVVCGLFLWRGSFTAAWLAALVGGLADLGYFMFLDLGGYVHFFPGTLMTLVSASAILLSIAAWRMGGLKNSDVA